jgi:hypothetical protein
VRRFEAALAQVQQTPLWVRFGLQPPALPAVIGPLDVAELSQAAAQGLHTIQQLVERDPDVAVLHGVPIATLYSL